MRKTLYTLTSQLKDLRLHHLHGKELVHALYQKVISIRSKLVECQSTNLQHISQPFLRPALRRKVSKSPKPETLLPLYIVFFDEDAWIFLHSGDYILPNVMYENISRRVADLNRRRSVWAAIQMTFACFS
jgi:hypothetical protein